MALTTCCDDPMIILACTAPDDDDGAIIVGPLALIRLYAVSRELMGAGAEMGPAGAEREGGGGGADAEGRGAAGGRGGIAPYTDKIEGPSDILITGRGRGSNDAATTAAS